MGMIMQLRKTYEFLPKQDGEVERDLTISGDDRLFEIGLTILVANTRYRASLKLEIMEVDYSNFDIETHVIEGLCKDLYGRLA